MNRSPLRPITEDEIQTFWEDGVVYLGPMFDSEWVERVGAAIDEAPGAYGERNFIWPVSEAVREMLFDSPLGEIAATLLRSETIGHMGDIEWVKDPHSESLTPWHQDQPYLQLGGRQTCNLWVGIDPATGENGAVEWVKGSPQLGQGVRTRTLRWQRAQGGQAGPRSGAGFRQAARPGRYRPLRHRARRLHRRPRHDGAWRRGQPDR